MKKHEMRNKLILAVVCINGSIFASQLPGTCQNTPVKSTRPDTSVLAIDGQPYSFKDLVGTSQAEIKSQFDKEVKKLSNDEITRRMISPGIESAPEEEKKTMPLQSAIDRRTAREVALWKSFRNNLLDQAAELLALSRVTDRIVREHRINLSDYFNLPVLRDAWQRQMAFSDFSYLHQKDHGTNNDEKLLAEVIKNYRFRYTRVYWDATSEEFRARPAFVKWSLELSRHLNKDGDVGIKVMLANSLLKEACETGIYQAKAKEFYQTKWGQSRVIDVVGYRGDPKTLHDFMTLAAAKEDNAALVEVSKLRLWLRDLAPGIKVTQRSVFGSDIQTGAVSPRPGVLYQPDPNTYRVVLSSVKTALPTQSKEQKEGTNLIHKIYAYQIAVLDLAPTVESRLPDWTPIPLLLNTNVAVEGPPHFISEVEIDPYVKKPYPGLVFEELEKNKGDLHSLSVKVAALSMQKDPTAATALITQIEKKMATLQTEPAKHAYRVISDRLKDGAKLAKEPSNSSPL
jgi:hypothetical protein